MNNIYKKIVCIWLSIAALFFLVPAGIIVVADPCHIFHRPIPGIFFHGFTGDARCQNAGLINTYLSDKNEGFDSILLGTSLSGNFLPEHISAKTRWRRTLKLTYPGAFPVEQKIIAERALETGNVKHVFWEFFPYQFMKYGSVNLDTLLKRNEFPVYLYNSNRFDDYRYILNFTSLGAVIGILNKDEYFNAGPIERIGFWDTGCAAEKTCKPLHLPEEIAQFRREYQMPHNVHRSSEERAAIDYSSVDKFLLAVLMPYCNTDVSFDMILPPLSMLHVARKTPQDFDYQLYMLRYVVEKSSTCKNIKVFAFGNEQWITGDLAHYYDPRHFYGSVHDYIIDATAAGAHVISRDNIDDYEKLYIENVNSYVPWASTVEQLRNSAH
jgi:hypothetical protein